jgi:hypothetical protein
VLLAAVALALAATPAWAAPGGAGAKEPKGAKLNAARLGPVRGGNGIVQSIRPHAVVVRQLDGRVLRVPVGPRTTVFVDGVRSSLDQVKPGFVVTFAVRAGRAALEVRARSIPAPSPVSTVTVVQSVTADAVVVTRPNGSTVTIAVGARTNVLLNGAPVTIADVRPGDVLVKIGGAGSGKKPARVLQVRRPG